MAAHSATSSGGDELPQRILVTGAAGFIGSHVAQALVDAGREVVGIDGFIDSYPRWVKERNLLRLRQSPRFTFTELDLRTDPLDAWVEGVDAVVNEAAFAGLPRSWHEVDAYVGCNLLAVQRLVDVCRRHGVRRFVQASTSSVYGLEAVGDELAPLRPVSPYGMSKLAAEHLLLSHVHAHDFPATILRYFSIYGPRQRPDMAYHIIIERLRRGEPISVFGDGHQSRSNTFVADCVAGTLAALSGAEVGEAYNIGGGVRLELAEAITIIADILGATPELRFGPPRAGDQRTTLADTSKARETFGYVPTVDPIAGLAVQVRWHVDVAWGDRVDQRDASRATPPARLVAAGREGR